MKLWIATSAISQTQEDQLCAISLHIISKGYTQEQVEVCFPGFWETWRNVGQRLEANFSRSNVRHSDFSQQQCSVYLQFTKPSHHRNKRLYCAVMAAWACCKDWNLCKAGGGWRGRCSLEDATGMPTFLLRVSDLSCSSSAFNPASCKCTLSEGWASTTQAATAHIGQPGWSSCSLFGPGQVPATAGVWGVNQKMKPLSLLNRRKLNK